MKAEISALLDDELDAYSANRALDALHRESSLRETWQSYHLIGDTLRRAPDISPDFRDKLAARLAQEAVILSPGAMASQKKKTMRYALPLAASVMGAAAVGWVAQSLNNPQALQRLAVVKPATQAAPLAVVSSRVVRDDVPKDYLVAHQAYSPSGRMQGVAPYVRTVSEIHQGGRQ